MARALILMTVLRCRCLMSGIKTSFWQITASLSTATFNVVRQAGRAGWAGGRRLRGLGRKRRARRAASARRAFDAPYQGGVQCTGVQAGVSSANWAGARRRILMRRSQRGGGRTTKPRTTEAEKRLPPERRPPGSRPGWPPTPGGKARAPGKAAHKGDGRAAMGRRERRSPEREPGTGRAACSRSASQPGMDAAERRWNGEETARAAGRRQGKRHSGGTQRGGGGGRAHGGRGSHRAAHTRALSRGPEA